MADNSDRRKKTLIFTVLAFLLAGGGVFLFFVIQGSNDLTGKNKNSNFSYGSAAREGVSSFFKSMGVIPEDEPKLSEAAVDRVTTRGIPLEELGVKDANPSISDWMAKGDGARSAATAPSGRPAAPTSVPKMSGGPSSSVGGGGGGSKSAGSVSRFGEGSGSGTTSVSNPNRPQASATGTTEKGTLGTLKNARSLLGEGLRSDSAMTASAKWNQSFGVGSGSNSGKGGDLAYNKSGLVNLDKIRSGEISNLKMDKKGSLKTPDVGAPEKDAAGTKAALSSDASVKKAAEDKEKAEIAKSAISAAGDALTKDNKAAGAGPGGGGAPNDPNQPPKDVMDSINNATCGQGCTTGEGNGYKDATRNISKNSDGTWTCEFKGEQVNKDGTVITYSDKVTYSATGTPLDLVVNEKPK